MTNPSESIDVDNMSKLCRACMKSCKENRKIYLFKKENIAEVYSKCTSLLLFETDGLPSFICKQCHNKLMECNKFRLTCTVSDKNFRTTLNNEETDISTVKSEPTIGNNDVEGDHEEKYETCNLNVVAEEENILSNNCLDAEISIDQNDLSDDLKVENKIEEDEDSNSEYMDDNSDDDHDQDYNLSNDDDDDSKDGSDCSGKVKRKIIKQTTNVSKIPNRNNRGEKAIFPCTLCKSKFFKERRLEGHIRQVHQGLKPALCKICNKEFSKWGGLDAHMSYAHSNQKKEFICDIPECGKAYLLKQALTSHQKNVHSGKPPRKRARNYMCEQCGKAFHSNATLKKHSYIHTGLMPYACTKCPKKYPTMHKLKEHMMRHEGIKNHVCPICGLRKTTLHELKVHVNYHTKEKLYPCKLCSHVFTSIGNRGRHVRIVHCGIKAYTCTHCDRSFGKAETLKHHIMTHTGEKPHECSVCGKRFIQLIALQTHMKTHKKVK